MLDFKKYYKESDTPYPTKPIKPEPYNEADPKVIKKYWQECNNYHRAMSNYCDVMNVKKTETISQFKKDLLEDLGLIDHSKAEKVYAMSIERYHSFEDIYNFAKKLTELIH